MNRHVMYPLLRIALLLLAVAHAAHASQATTVVTVWGQAVAAATQTQAQTRRAAKNHARMLAVEQVAGTRVDAAGLIESGLERAHFLQTMARGYVVHEEVLNWKMDTYQKRPTDPPIPVLRVKLQVEVAPLPKAVDPTFAPKVSINRSTFETGDRALLTMASQRDAWVYLFNITANDQVVPLFPNPYQEDNHLHSGRAVTFPDPECGVSLEMAPLPGHTENAEAFLAVAFPAAQPVAEHFTSGKAVPISEFYRRLMLFPMASASLKVVPYVVRAKGPANLR